MRPGATADSNNHVYPSSKALECLQTMPVQEIVDHGPALPVSPPTSPWKYAHTLTPRRPEPQVVVPKSKVELRQAISKLEDETRSLRRNADVSDKLRLTLVRPRSLASPSFPLTGSTGNDSRRPAVYRGRTANVLRTGQDFSSAATEARASSRPACAEESNTEE